MKTRLNQMEFNFVTKTTPTPSTKPIKMNVRIGKLDPSFITMHDIDKITGVLPRGDGAQEAYERSISSVSHDEPYEPYEPFDNDFDSY